MSTDLSHYIKALFAVLNDPDLRLKVQQGSFALNGNPIHAWEAIDICFEHKREFPDWLSAYLAGCAKRLLSDDVKEANDVRKVLPRVFGFRKTKRGPGNMLAARRNDYNRTPFALAFAVKINNGVKPSDALKRACEALDEDDNFDDKTLRGWVLDFFEQEKWLRSNAEWKSVVRNQFMGVARLVQEKYREIAP
jgi:hypothetical protein